MLITRGLGTTTVSREYNLPLYPDISISALSTSVLSTKDITPVFSTKSALLEPSLASKDLTLNPIISTEDKELRSVLDIASLKPILRGK